MTVSLESTRRKYHGRKAATYEAVRVRQRRWHLENEAVAKLLRGFICTSVLDVPVGTGRFLKLYDDLQMRTVHGVDASEEMLALAQKKPVARLLERQGRLTLEQGDATSLRWSDGTVDVVVCVRLLDLLDEQSMTWVVREICRVARRAVILTIRLGDEYVPKSNTATHDRARFNRVVRGLGWRIEESVPIFDAGWTVMRLGRRTEQ